MVLHMTLMTESLRIQLLRNIGRPRKIEGVPLKDLQGLLGMLQRFPKHPLWSHSDVTVMTMTTLVRFLPQIWTGKLMALTRGSSPQDLTVTPTTFS